MRKNRCEFASFGDFSKIQRSQYDLAKMTRRLLGSPVMMQRPCSSGAPNGMHRIVTLSSSLTFSSTAAWPFQWQRANPPWSSSCKKVIKLFPPIQSDDMPIAECKGFLQKTRLDLHENRRNRRGDLASFKWRLLFMRPVAPQNGERLGLDFPLPHFDAKRHSFLDPAPAFFSAAKIAFIDDDF